MKVKSDKAITLIALIITVIILVIIAAVSVGVLIDNDFFNKAQDTVGRASSELENQKQQEANADEEWKNVPGKTVKSGTKVESGIEFSVTTSDITRTSFKISAQGTNKYGDALTYTLIMTDKDWKENAIQEYSDPIKATGANEIVYWDLTGLTPNTTYYFKVIATDGRADDNKVSVESSETTLKNNEPIITANLYIDEQKTNEFKIKMQAKDSDKDNLIYELLVLENEEYYSVWSSTVASETTETITVNSINGKAVKEYTQYNWKFRVTDIFEASAEAGGNLRTYCPGGSTCPIGKLCEEVSTSKTECTCDKGYVICGENMYWDYQLFPANVDKFYCFVCGELCVPDSGAYYACCMCGYVKRDAAIDKECARSYVGINGIQLSCPYTCSNLVDCRKCEGGYIETQNTNCPIHTSCTANHYWCSEHACVSTANGHEVKCTHSRSETHND